MKDPDRPVPLEALLAHAEWLGALARSLVRDPARAEDVVQETWLAAIEHPPREARSVRAWLATVARNAARAVWRSERRRERRERSVARDRVDADVSLVAARIDEGRRLVALVQALDEPDRSTILLRYFDGLAPAEIAARLGVPASTVRSRLQRALARLRSMLDEREGGDRRAWTVALAPLAVRPRIPAPGGAVAGAIAGRGPIPAVVAMGLAAVALLVVGAVWVDRNPPSPDRDASPRTVARVDGDRLDRDLATADRGIAGPGSPVETDSVRPSGLAGSGRPDRAGPASSSASAPDTTASAAIAAGERCVFGDVRDRDGRPFEGVEIALEPSAAGRSSSRRTTTSDSTGAWRFTGLDPGRYRLVAAHPERATHVATVELPPDADAGPIEMTMSEGGALAVRVRDAFGAPVEGATLSVSAEGVARVGRTDRDGRLRVERLEAGRYRVRWETGEGRGVVGYATVLTGSDASVELRGGGVLTGTVWGADGAPKGGVVVRLTLEPGRDRAYRAYEGQTDADGSYRVEGVPEGRYAVHVQTAACVVAVGTQRIWNGGVEVRLIRIEPGSLVGRVTDGTEPLDRTRVQIAATPLCVRADGSVERGTPLLAFARDDGRFELAGIAPGRYELWCVPLVDGGLGEVRRVVDVPLGGGADPIEIELPARPLGRLRLLVVEPDGTPVARASFGLVRRTDGRTSTTTLHPREEGGAAYELALEPGRHEIRVERAGFRPGRVVVEIAAGTVVEKRLRLEPERPPDPDGR